MAEESKRRAHGWPRTGAHRSAQPATCLAPSGSKRGPALTESVPKLCGLRRPEPWVRFGGVWLLIGANRGRMGTQRAACASLGPGLSLVHLLVAHWASQEATDSGHAHAARGLWHRGASAPGLSLVHLLVAHWASQEATDSGHAQRRAAFGGASAPGLSLVHLLVAHWASQEATDSGHAQRRQGVAHEEVGWRADETLDLQSRTPTSWSRARLRAAAGRSTRHAA
jgi:hypothetical protein